MDASRQVGDLTPADIKPEVPDSGGTVIFVQRHEEYNRQGAVGLGSLAAEAAARIESQAIAVLGGILNNLPLWERSSVCLLVVASDTRFEGVGQRSMETAQKVIDGARLAFAEAGVTLTTDHILNDSGHFRGLGTPRPTAALREPLMLADCPQFVRFLVDKYGAVDSSDKRFWTAFEEDWEREARLTMGAEGPDEMAMRLHRSIRVLARFSFAYHRRHPGSRLIIWAVSHYDTISPYVKRYVIDVPKSVFVGVTYGGGMTVRIGTDRQATTQIGGNLYQVPVSR